MYLHIYVKEIIFDCGGGGWECLNNSASSGICKCGVCDSCLSSKWRPSSSRISSVMLLGSQTNSSHLILAVFKK